MNIFALFEIDWASDERFMASVKLLAVSMDRKRLEGLWTDRAKLGGSARYVIQEVPVLGLLVSTEQAEKEIKMLKAQLASTQDSLRHLQQTSGRCGCDEYRFGPGS